MYGLSIGHLVILFLVLLLFGPRRIPEIGRALGEGIGALKRTLEGRSQDAERPEKTSFAAYSGAGEGEEDRGASGRPA